MRTPTMPDDGHLAPKPVDQVMVSSTFYDLKQHRAALISAINGIGLHAKAMEDSSAGLDDVIESSLRMVRDSAAYIGLISLKYGQTPEDPMRNPGRRSLTELEFDEAQRLGRPILLFVMGDKHLGGKDDFERDPDKERKLNEFRHRAKQSGHGSKVNRVYDEFDSLDEFKTQIGPALTKLSHFLTTKDHTTRSPNTTAPSTPSARHTIPQPPAFYATTDYIGRTRFIGRSSQLQTLNDWAQPNDTNTVLLFTAIGGNGKSMLTWEWATKHATRMRSDWAGRFWYSFYEKGAIMRQFCQHALAYMTQQPLEAFEKQSTPQLRVALIAELRQKPWLLVLDGLERVLVAYHRIDAAELRDDEVNQLSDKILDSRNIRDAIHDEDTDLLRALATATPSKILISSRLVPSALLNVAGLPQPGVKQLELPGLDEADAEALLRDCGVQGTSESIRYYLTNYCGNHPLVIGVLAGLINSPGPHRSNFDAWAADPDYGAKLNLASLDLIQSRNHILRAAVEALSPASRQLLSTLSLLSGAVDYETITALNPYLPPRPERKDEPINPEELPYWPRLRTGDKRERRKSYQAALSDFHAYEKAVKEWEAAVALCKASKDLDATVDELEERGLLYYDRTEQRYDLHPVVRGFAAGSLLAEDKESYGLKLIDHFNAKPHSPYEIARTMGDVDSGLQIVRTLLKIGHRQSAAGTYHGDLSAALLFNLEVYSEVLSLLRPFFPNGWDKIPSDIDESSASLLANDVAIALGCCGHSGQAIKAHSTLLAFDMERQRWSFAVTSLMNISSLLSSQFRIAQAIYVLTLSLDFAEVIEQAQSIFRGRLDLFLLQSRAGLWPQAEATWLLLEPMGRKWERGGYRQGDAEFCFAAARYWRGELQEKHLDSAVAIASQHQNRSTLRFLHWLRGTWQLEQEQWAEAAASLTEALTMARSVRLSDEETETALALAKAHAGQLVGDAAISEAQRLSELPNPDHRALALLWKKLGYPEQAKRHALSAYTWAWADGEPFVHRYELTKTTELLHELGVPIPELPSYDPAKDEPFPWEADVRAAIEKLKAEKQARTKD